MNDNKTLRFDFEDGEELLNELNNGTGVSPDLLQHMTDEMNQVRINPNSILLVGTEGSKAVTIYMAPRSFVLADGPVLVPTCDTQRIASMVSREFIESHAITCDQMSNQDDAQQRWNDLLDGLFNQTIELANTALTN